MAAIENGLKNLNFLTSIFLKKLLISQNRDGQPTVEFHRQHDTMHVYRLIPRGMHFYVLCGRERYQKPPKKRMIGVISKMEGHPSKSGFLRISR
jgi:hypothetical protein